MDGFKELLIVIVVFMVVLFGMLAILFAIGAYGCSSYSDVTGMKTKYAAGTCYVNSGDKFIPYKEHLNKDVGNKIIVK